MKDVAGIVFIVFLLHVFSSLDKFLACYVVVHNHRV